MTNLFIVKFRPENFTGKEKEYLIKSKVNVNGHVVNSIKQETPKHVFSSKS